MPKKIIEGCTAIIVDGAQVSGLPTNIGKIVKVGRYIGNIPEHPLLRDIWYVDQLMFYTSGRDLPYAPEKAMERIDEDDVEENSNENVEELEQTE